ncbi:MAG TPA: DUF255 domain-containing protein [Planctomycetota bacterium]|nr:DUF255 domain-containing protein [Planctomycetota bacterium]
MSSPAASHSSKDSSHSGKGPHKYTNALAKETSPYLLQHAHNPVNWYPWGREAFEKAKAEDKPIFLSVGYSSCHWCHVMERESFENEDVAKVLNEHFISIKVDREERPDVDEIYMSAVQLITQRGGWPMTVFMTHDGRPFFGGTYFPAQHFIQLLQRVDNVWKTKKADLLQDADRLADAVRDHLSRSHVPAEGKLDAKLALDCVDALAENFDKQNGGFGTRPKFPPNNGLPLLLYLQQKHPDNKTIREITTTTLDKMALGGIHDHLAGGFHRYSTDEVWLLPHFEKMLYDNALLSRSYAEASVVYGNPEYARVARGVYDWVLREMTSPEGAFYSTLDADSEGHEGKFYVWSRTEVEQILGGDAALFCEIYNIHKDGNFREEATGEDTGLNIPHLSEPLAEHAKRLKLDEAALRAKLDANKAALMAVRVKRVWPGLDDKILTSWNALMISSFARGSIWLKEPRYRDTAVKAADFLLKELRTLGGRWLATHRKGESKLNAYLDDHAFLAVAFLDLFDATGDERWKKEAAAVIALLDKHFADSTPSPLVGEGRGEGRGGGGYFFTADDHEKLLARTKDPIDKAIPSGNGWAAQALVRLAKVTVEKRYAERAEALFKEFQGLMERAPQATESMLYAVAEHYADAKPSASAASPEKAQPKIQRGPVIAELFVGKSALRAGGSTPIAVRFGVDEGWHIQAPGGVLGDDAATKVSLASKDLGTLGTISFPEAKALSSPQLGGELKVYEGEVTAGALLKVPPDAKPGKQMLAVKVHFQACSKKVCEKPEALTLSIPVEVVGPDTRVEEINSKVFDGLKLE